MPVPPVAQTVQSVLPVYAHPALYGGSTYWFAALLLVTVIEAESHSSFSPGIRCTRQPSRKASVTGACASKLAAEGGPPLQAAIHCSITGSRRCAGRPPAVVLLAGGPVAAHLPPAVGPKARARS